MLAVAVAVISCAVRSAATRTASLLPSDADAHFLLHYSLQPDELPELSLGAVFANSIAGDTPSYRWADAPLTVEELRRLPLFSRLEGEIRGDALHDMPDADDAAVQAAYALLGVAFASRANLDEAFRRVGGSWEPGIADYIRDDWQRYPESRWPPNLRTMPDSGVMKHGMFGTSPLVTVFPETIRVRTAVLDNTWGIPHTPFFAESRIEEFLPLNRDSPGYGARFVYSTPALDMIQNHLRDLRPTIAQVCIAGRVAVANGSLSSCAGACAEHGLDPVENPWGCRFR